MTALVLSPCCWPRRREFARGDSDELRELARLMCLKASTADTYAAWAQHLWGRLAATAANTVEGDGGDETRMVLGTRRDRDILSEKNITLLALKKDRRSCNAAVHAHKRYVASSQVGAWSRYAALREVYGLPVEHMGMQGGRDKSGACRPHPPLVGNVKPLHSLLSSREHGEDGFRSSSQSSEQGDSSRRARKRRRQQTAADDAIILDHVVSDALLFVVFSFMCEPDFDHSWTGQASFGLEL